MCDVCIFITFVNHKHLKKVNKIKSYQEFEIKRTSVSQMWVKYVTPEPIHTGPFPLQHRLFWQERRHRLGNS